MTSQILAIDIQYEQISYALLTHGFNGICIVETECIKIVQKATCNKGIEETKKNNLFQALKNALTEILLKTDNLLYNRCIISIPSDYFFFRTLELPFKNKKKISQILAFELENYLPMPSENLESVFCILDKLSKNAPAKNMTGVASIQKNYMDQFRRLFNECNIHVDTITIGSGYSEAIVYAKTARRPSFSIFINAESVNISVYLIKSGEIALIRTFLFDSADSGKSLKINIMHTLLSFNELFNNASLNNPLMLDEIAVSGNSVFIHKLCNDIEKAMDVEVHDFNIFNAARTITRPLSEQPADNNSINNAIAMGINWIKRVDTYNFCRETSNFALFYQENKLNIFLTTALCLFVFLSWLINPIIQIDNMKKTKQKLNNRIIQVFSSCFPNVKKIVDPVHQMEIKIDALQQKKEIKCFNEYPLCIDLLNNISRTLPVSLDIKFTKFVRTGNNMLIMGSADQFNTIDKMKNNLKNIKLFKKVAINSASMDNTDGRVKFSLKISLLAPAALNFRRIK